MEKPIAPKMPVSTTRWIERYERSKKMQKPFLDDSTQFRRAYLGDYSRKKGHRVLEDKMSVNFIYQYAETVQPYIFAGQPKVFVKPKMPQYEPTALNMQENINYWAKELNTYDEFDEACFDSFFGHAAVEVGWDYQTELREQPVDEPMTMSDGSPALHPDTGEPMTQSVMKQQEFVRKDRPFLRRRNPFDIYFDPDTPRRKDSRYMIVRDVVTHEYFLGMSEIPQDLKDKVKPNLRPDQTSEDAEMYYTLARDNKSDSEWVELLTIWDKEHELKIIISPQYKDEPLAVSRWPYEMDYEEDPFPVTIYDGKRDFMSPYTFSEFRPVWDHILEINRVRTAFLIHMKRSLPKYMYNKATGTRAQMSKLMSSRSDEASELNNPEGLKIVPTAPMPQELFAWEQMLQKDIENVSSLYEYQGENNANTATEASIVQSHADVRKTAKSNRFQKFVTTCLGKMGQLCQQFQDEKVAISIANGQGDTHWLHVSKEEIQGEFAFEMEPGTIEYHNEMMERQQVLQYAQMMANNPNVDQRKMAIKITEAFGFHPDDILMSQQQMQQNQKPPEPTIKFAPINITDIPAALAQAEIVKAAMQQNQVADDPNAPAELGEHMGGVQDLVAPKGGKVPLAPVSGQQMPHPMSTIQGGPNLGNLSQ